MVKTYDELEKQKNEKEKHFGNKYEYYIQYLTDCFISKLGGTEIVKYELSKWDEDCKDIIFNDLVSSLMNMRIIDFDDKKFYEEVIG